MDYFKRLLEGLEMEKKEDRRSYEALAGTLSVAARRAAGMSWYPIAIKDSETGYGDYLTIEVERTTHQDILHQFRFGTAAALFSNHDPQADRVEGTVTYVNGNKLKISLRIEELPDWARDGKLGIDAVFDENSYAEMQTALKQAQSLAEKNEEGRLVRILTGNNGLLTADSEETRFSGEGRLNEAQRRAVDKILGAGELAIVHGPPGTGKTTTLVQAIKALYQRDRQRVLVVAPSNAAVDLLTEKLFEEGLRVVRIGNPSRVSEAQLEHTLDSQLAQHATGKEIRRLKKQAAAYRDMAQKYKRSFGPREREQRKALFAEARNLHREIEKMEHYIIDDVLAGAAVITATLVGAHHYSIRSLQYQTVIIDEAGQALEPACWIPILKGKKLVMAGDHCQLPPTLKSTEAAQKGLGTTLMEKCVSLHPGAVVLLEEQYRMHERIAGFPSREFYQGRLRAHDSVARHQVFPGDPPLLFLDTAGCGYEEVWEGTSISNPEEAAFLLRHLAAFLEDAKNAHPLQALPSIGVISPYKRQVESLRESVAADPRLREAGALVTVNTIDSFQGQEKDVMYISMTRSNADSTIGFLSEIRRMNVAMTRARKKLVVVGDSATLSQHSFYADFIEYAQEHQAYHSAWEFMA
ncbi:MAG: AAA domain-containing protein [Flavisolibacter sp.]